MFILSPGHFTSWLVLVFNMKTVLTVLTHLIFLQLVQGSVTNIARNKPASMSSNFYNSYNASTAVDGNTDAVWPDVMNTAPGQSFAWWKVDLKRDVQDATVKIYFRTDYKFRRNGVQIYTFTTPFSSYPEGQLCHTFTGDTNGTDIDDVVSVTCPGRWRYLLIYTRTDNAGDGPVLDFGEVMVLICSDGTYGGNCIKTCNSRHCVTMTTRCDRDGRCPGGCQTGWTGVDCTQMCSSGMYGDHCFQLCSDRHCLNSSAPCSSTLGSCDGDCRSGWRGTDCTQVCQTGMYGVNCMKSCSSRPCVTPSSECDRQTGQCIGGCQEGWRGVDCTQVCPPGKYGMNCVQNCGQCNGTCGVVDGHCPAGCLEGYCGQQCKNKLTGGVPATTVVAAVVGSVLVVVLVGVGILLCLIRQGRLQWVKVTNKDKSNQNTGDNTQMRNLGQEHVSDNEHAHSRYGYNNDYAELNAETQTGNKDYDVIQQKHYQNA